MLTECVSFDVKVVAQFPLSEEAGSLFPVEEVCKHVYTCGNLQTRVHLWEITWPKGKPDSQGKCQYVLGIKPVYIQRRMQEDREGSECAPNRHPLSPPPNRRSAVISQF